MLLRKGANRRKQSIKMYRNINGIKYEQWSSETLLFDALKKECKKLGLRFRIINDEFFREIHE